MYSISEQEITSDDDEDDKVECVPGKDRRGSGDQLDPLSHTHYAREEAERMGRN